MATRQGGGLDSSQGGGWIAYRAAVDGYKTGRRLAAYRAAVGCLQGGGLLLFLESALGRDTAGRKQPPDSPPNSPPNSPQTAPKQPLNSPPTGKKKPCPPLPNRLTGTRLLAPNRLNQPRPPLPCPFIRVYHRRIRPENRTVIKPSPLRSAYVSAPLRRMLSAP